MFFFARLCVIFAVLDDFLIFFVEGTLESDLVDGYGEGERRRLIAEGEGRSLVRAERRDTTDTIARRSAGSTFKIGA